MLNTAECAVRYIEGLQANNFFHVPFDADVTFDGPVLEQLVGRAVVVETLTQVAHQMTDIRVKQQIVQGEHACVLFQFVAAGEVIEVCDYFRVSNGSIVEVRAFFDPRPIVS